jgi:hypothetical protein
LDWDEAEEPPATDLPPDDAAEPEADPAAAAERPGDPSD